MMSQKFIERHHQVGQIVGVGFPTSVNSLYRELRRSVDYIFTNHIPELSNKLDNSLPQPSLE